MLHKIFSKILVVCVIVGTIIFLIQQVANLKIENHKFLILQNLIQITEEKNIKELLDNNDNIQIVIIIQNKIIASNITDLKKKPIYQDFSNKSFISYQKEITYKEQKAILNLSQKLPIFDIYLQSSFLIVGTFLIIFISLYLFCKNYFNTYIERKKMLDSFFNDAMHELKTPLGIAYLNLEMLTVKNKQTQRIKAALKQMKMTYEDVEFFIKNNYISFPTKTLDFSLLLRDRIRFINIIARTKNIIIHTTNLDCALVLISEIEAIRLIDNNLSNAIKYSNKDSEIFIKLEKEHDVIIFSIKNFGAPIKNPTIIWEKYTRAENSLGGFGLGLNIVKKICLKYEINFSAYSQDGYTKFIYKIPLYQQKLLDNL